MPTRGSSLPGRCCRKANNRRQPLCILLINAPVSVRQRRPTGEISMVDIRPSETKSETVRSRRPREHLTEAEIERLMTVARQAADMVTAMPRQSWSPSATDCARASWSSCNGDQIDFVQKTIRINRVKNGTGATHYLSNSELRALRRLQRENPPGTTSSSPSAAGRSRRHGSAR
jgi:hypothetical protein